MGTALLERSSGGSILTPDGLTVVTRARHAVHAFDLAISGHVASRTLTIGYTWSILGRYTNDAFQQWESTGDPDVDLYLRRFQDRSGGVDSGAADLAVVRTLAPTSKNRVLLFAERRVAAVSIRHRFSRRDVLRMEDYQGETVILNSVSGSTTMEAWAHRGVSMEPPLLVESIDEWNHLVSLNKGIGLTPESTRVMHPYPGINYIDVCDAPPAPVWLIWENAAFEQIARKFAEVVHQVIQKETVNGRR